MNLWGAVAKESPYGRPRATIGTAGEWGCASGIREADAANERGRRARLQRVRRAHRGAGRGMAPPCPVVMRTGYWSGASLEPLSVTSASPLFVRQEALA